MKKLKVLIISEDESSTKMLTERLSRMLLTLDLEADVLWVRSCEEAEVDLTFAYDDSELIAIDIPLYLSEAPSLMELMEFILAYHKKAVSFFISSDVLATAKVKEFGLNLCFLKDGNQIINPCDLKKIEEALKMAGKMSYQMLHKYFANPICIFCTTYADSTPSEAWSQNACNEVAKRLNCKQIHYSVIDPVGYSISIYVDDKKVQDVKKIAESSDLEFWVKWSKEYLK